MREPDRHDGRGARTRRASRATSTTPRVLTDAGARAARHWRRSVPHLFRARGCGATRGPRPPPQEALPYGAGRRPGSRFPTGRVRKGAGRTARPPPGSA